MAEVRIKKVIDWTLPFFGNNHIMPYGKLLVTDGETDKVCKTKGDLEWDNVGYQYITFKRKRYRVIKYYDGSKRRLRLEEIKR